MPAPTTCSDRNASAEKYVQAIATDGMFVSDYALREALKSCHTLVLHGCRLNGDLVNTCFRMRKLIMHHVPCAPDPQVQGVNMVHVADAMHVLQYPVITQCVLVGKFVSSCAEAEHVCEALGSCAFMTSVEFVRHGMSLELALYLCTSLGHCVTIKSVSMTDRWSSCVGVRRMLTGTPQELVMVLEQKLLGGVKTCRHVLVHVPPKITPHTLSKVANPSENRRTFTHSVTNL